ncbi:MAG: class I SAM-dependent RNA methyltransferase [Myxococcales bacterium]|nr:class I SAM-dependent RNA methyltransferase [Myxococcales bacterium]
MLEVERLAADGEAIARAPDGRVVFLWGAAPGDRVEVQLDRVRKRHAHGHVVRRLADGPDRVPAPCPHAEVCGGCPWQGIDRATQRAALARHVGHLLQRAVGHPVEVDVVPTAAGLGWRSTARLHWQDGRLGYHGHRTATVLDVDACPVLAPPLDTLLATVRATLGPHLRGTGTLRLSAGPGAEAGTVHLAGPLPPALAAAARTLPGLPGCQGVVLELFGKRPERLGKTENLIGGVPHPADAFLQAHGPGAAALVAAVLDRLPTPGPLLELYAGSGAFTVPLAQRGHRVTAVEFQGAAAQALAETARATGLPIDARAGDAAQPPRQADGRPFPIALLDPPRAGAADAVAALHAAGTERLIYVACDPATLARDVGWLAARGWRLLEAEIHDLFPHTGHVETLAVLARG